MTTEKVYQGKIILPHLTRPEERAKNLSGKKVTIPQEELGLGWTHPKAGKDSSTAICSSSGLLWSDTLTFLKGGNKANEKAWAQLVDRERRSGGAGTPQSRAEELARAAVAGRLEQVDSVLDMFRTDLVINGLRFSLWNRKPSTGDRQQDLEEDLYHRNSRRVSSEITVMGEPLPLDFDMKLGGRAGKPGFVPKIRLDIGFHLNGIPYSYIEVKSKGSGQSAKEEGRRQLAQDFADFAIPALLRLYAEHERTEQRPWPGLTAHVARLPNIWRRRAINALPLWLGKSAWRVTLDMRETYIAPPAWDSLTKVDALLMSQLQARQRGEDFDWDKNYGQLLKDLTESTGELPKVLLDDKPRSLRTGWDQPQAHLGGMLSTIGLDQEIQQFGRRSKRKDVHRVDQMDLLTPRPPQRVALGQIQSWAERMYAHEAEPDWLEKDLRERLEATMPGLTPEDVERRINERLRFRNGQDAYSILIQGAAGVGKTHLAIWSALTLHSMLEKDTSGKYTSQPMFDYIVVLTDRVELRKNIAEASDISRGSRGMVQEIETSQDLIETLSGAPRKGTGRILVVNLQKFPSLREKISKGKLSIRRSGGRIAFIIDEIHRSNQGKLNAETLDTFLDEVGELGASVGTQGKKNLIIGLTATPTDPILARFGQWRTTGGLGSHGDWTPHFAYGMSQAINDGHVLDPLQALMRLETVLEIEEEETLAGADGKDVASDIQHLSVYEHPEYQRQAAEAFAKVFLTTTMAVIRDSNQANLVGRGKAMITMPSVKAAIDMQKAVRKALLDKANNAKGQAWERYAHIAKDVAENRIFILYSNPGKRASIAQREETGIDGGCGILNPLLNGAQRTEEGIIEGFRCKEAGSDGNARNAIIIVVDKLLTGFDESSLHTLMICRSLQGVGLLQAMCRVNRTRALKENCLVVDASYDPDGAGLGPEAKRVFARYGGLTASNLDGMDLYQRIIAQRIELLKDKDVAQGWRDWRQAKEDETHQMRAVSLAAGEILDRLDGELVAKKLRRKMGGYLSLQRLAAPIMKLDDKDTDERFLKYLHRLHNHLRASSSTDDQAPVQFTVKEVDFVSGQDWENIPVHDVPRKKRSRMDDLEDEWVKTHVGDGKDLDFEALRELQAKKAELVIQFRNGVRDLCEGIDLAIETKPSLAQHRDNLLEQGEDLGDAIAEFRKLMSWVSILKIIGPDGKTVRWKDAVPERRKAFEWFKEDGRLGYTMGVWLDASKETLKTGD